MFITMADKTDLKLNIPAGGFKQAVLPLLGKVENTAKEGIYAVKEQAVVGRQYLVICPVCRKPILVKASEPRVVRAMHKTCNASIIIRAVAPTNQGNEAPKTNGSNESSEKGEGVILTDVNVVLGSKTNAKLSWWSLTGRPCCRSILSPFPRSSFIRTGCSLPIRSRGSVRWLFRIMMFIAIVPVMKARVSARKTGSATQKSRSAASRPCWTIMNIWTVCPAATGNFWIYACPAITTMTCRQF